MRKTTQSTCPLQERLLITTEELQSLLGCGRVTAVRLATDANAKVMVGSRVLWNRARLANYLGC